MNASAKLLDAEISHAIGGQRWIIGRGRVYTNDAWRTIVDAAAGVVAASFDTPQIILPKLRDELVPFYSILAAGLEDDIGEAAAYETAFQRRIIERSAAGLLPENLVLTPPNAIIEALRRAAVQGFDAKGAMGLLAEQLARATSLYVLDQLDTGQELGKVLEALHEGRRGLGPMFERRVHMETWVRSLLQGGFANARHESFAFNAQLFDGEIWSGVLDHRITAHICLPRDGHLYDIITHQPLDGGLPWLSGPGLIHFRCRSLGSPVWKRYDVLGLDGRTRTTREAFDGTVPIKTTAEEWARRQPLETLEGMFGKQRARAFKGGEQVAEMLRGDTVSFRSLDELGDFDSLP